jgi:hypothetical protein
MYLLMQVLTLVFMIVSVAAFAIMDESASTESDLSAIQKTKK